MKQLLLISCLLCMALALSTGCATERLEPLRTCEVHHTQMHNVAIRGTGLCVLPPGRYSEARAALFPNTLPLYLPKGRVSFWLCDACRSAEQQWYATHTPTSGSSQLRGARSGWSCIRASPAHSPSWLIRNVSQHEQGAYGVRNDIAG
jgi:hypothetical protein